MTRGRGLFRASGADLCENPSLGSGHAELFLSGREHEMHKRQMQEGQ